MEYLHTYWLWGLYAKSGLQGPLFYYGGLIESKREGVYCDREGYGTEYKLFNTTPSSEYDYAVFRGEWHNDAPNGPGSEYRHGKVGRDSVRIAGNYIDWYEDGEMIRDYSEKGLKFIYNVVNRMPVSIEADDIVASAVSNGQKYYLHMYNIVQTALMEYTGYKRGNASSVRTNWWLILFK